MKENSNESIKHISVSDKNSMLFAHDDYSMIGKEIVVNDVTKSTNEVSETSKQLHIK